MRDKRKSEIPVISPLTGAPAKQQPVDGMDEQRAELTTSSSTWAPAWTTKTIFANWGRDGGARIAVQNVGEQCNQVGLLYNGSDGISIRTGEPNDERSRRTGILQFGLVVQTASQ